VHAKLAPGGQAPALLGASSGNVPKTSRSRALRASGTLGVGVGVGLFGLGVLVGLAVPHAAQRELEPSAARPVQLDIAAHGAERSSQPAVAPPPVPAAPTSALTPGNEQPLPKPVARRSTVHRRDTERDWRGELTLLERAEKAVRADSAAFALALLAEFDARYPRSRLSEERQAIELMAHCQARATDAAARAERFRRAHPNSVYAQRIAEVCASARSELTDKAEGGGH